MDVFLIALPVALAALVAAGWMTVSARRDVASIRVELEAERAANQSAQTARATAEERARAADGRRDELILERDRAMQDAAQAEQRRVQAERDAALDRQAVAAIEKRMADWEGAQKQAIEAAKAATLEAGAQLSSKLLEDHKREAEAARVAADEKAVKTAAELVANVKAVNEFAAALREQVTLTQQTVDKVNRALSNPSGAGQFGEMILENTLKAHGLERERDFVLQQTAGERGLRPDALVFLPGDAVLVIDSKSSRFLLDLAEATDDAMLAAARARLSDTMNIHLRALAGKDYGKAVRDDYKRAGRQSELRLIVNALFVPTDGALEHLRAADPGFFTRAADAGIMPVGPAGLASLLTIAHLQIEAGRRAENHERIVEAAERLAESVVTALTHMAKIGKGLHDAADSYEALAGSVDSRLTPRLRALGKLGVATKAPRPLPHFKVVEIESLAIEGNAELVGDTALPAPAGRDE